MTNANTLPAILIPRKPNSPISVYRALKNIKRHLEEHTMDNLSEMEQDSLQAAIDDCEVMMLNIE